MRKILTFSLFAIVLATLCAAEPKTEIGEINGAKFRIDIPESWNGGLVVYCHGYNAKAVAYDNRKLPALFQVFLDQGYALAQSGYAAGGWAIQEAAVDTESLRRYFVEHHGQPKETYITGHSMGGFLTMMLMETYPTVYDAGLPLCGPLAPPNWFQARGAFDGRVLFDYFFPGVLPNPAKTDPAFEDKPEVRARILALLDGAPDKADALRRLNGLKSNKDLANTLVFITYLLKELQQRAGGNPFDNRNVVYGGTFDVNAVNAGVARYAADPKAAAYIRQFYTPTGKILHPMLAVHTSYDPLVPTWIPNMYQVLAEQAGTADLFVQQYVQHDGHCNITAPEVAHAFQELRDWKSKGVRPTAGEDK
jgi:pimeloyl-ACP methyl ester carboxylesterase